MIQSLSIPIDAIVFDCDGTLSRIEGIDELARQNNVGDEVSALTTQAMSVSGITPELYRERLDLVKPTQTQISQLGQLYYDQTTLNSQTVITIFQNLNKTIYIVSSGIFAAVADFARKLNISSQNVFAVPIFFDSNGRYTDFDHHSPLVQPDGKKLIVNNLLKRHKSILHIGDGINDYATVDIVTRFVGYGGVFYRESMAKICQYYITSQSMLPLLPLALTIEEYNHLSEINTKHYQQGLDQYHQGVRNV